MAISQDKAPGYFPFPTAVQWNFSADITHALIGSDTNVPSISKYIAYDTLPTPNPFIAVTEDGRGRVVYDGGFPKFYNDYAPAASATFAQLSGSFKYLYNALKWVANPAKTSIGNNKILILGDAAPGEPYNVVETTSNRFRTSLANICAIAGFVPTFKTRNDYQYAMLGPTLAELEQYCAILIMGSTYAPANQHYITNYAVSDIVTFRENGNGIIMITDHGPDLNNIAEATANLTGFFNICNQVAVKFGAYFTGVYERTPVNVGFLRANYGDHPLYAGMTNAEDIIAGGSESKVVVTTTSLIPVDTAKRLKIVSCYDNANRTPMIIETDDGLGKCVFDGDAHALRNVKFMGDGLTFEGLLPRFKVLRNMIEYVANPTKVAANNKTILVLSDSVTGHAYDAGTTLPGGFKTTLDKIAAGIGYSVTYKNASTYGTALNPTLAELNPYAVVIVVSIPEIAYNVSRLTVAAAAAFDAYRAAGGGMVWLSDIGIPIADYNAATLYATTGVGNSGTVNRYLTRFGAWSVPLSGGQVQTEVSFITDAYGDHPIYKNIPRDDILDNDDGGCGTFTSIWFSTAGKTGTNVLNVLAKKADNSIETARVTYVVASGDLLDLKNASNISFANSVLLGAGDVFEFKPNVNGAGLGTVWGEIKKGGVRIGEVTYDSTNGSRFFIYGQVAGANGTSKINLKKGDNLSIELVNPFSYKKIISFVAPKAQLEPVRRTAQRVQLSNSVYSTKEGMAAKALKAVHNAIKSKLQYMDQPQPVGLAAQLKRVESFENGRLLIDPVRMVLVDTVAQGVTYRSTTPINPGMCLLVVDDGSVWGYKAGSWGNLGLTHKQAIGGHRIVWSTLISRLYMCVNTDALTLITYTLDYHAADGLCRSTGIKPITRGAGSYVDDATLGRVFRIPSSHLDGMEFPRQQIATNEDFYVCFEGRLTRSTFPSNIIFGEWTDAGSPAASCWAISVSQDSDHLMFSAINDVGKVLTTYSFGTAVPYGSDVKIELQRKNGVLTAKVNNVVCPNTHNVSYAFNQPNMPFRTFWNNAADVQTKLVKRLSFKRSAHW